MLDALNVLQQKVLGASVLNGGFDTLVLKIDKIEEGQEHLKTSVDSMHDAMYDPDDGLFAKVKVVEQAKEKIDNVNRLEKDVFLLQQKDKSNDKEVEKEAKVHEQQIALVTLHIEQLKELMHFKARFVTVFKWILVTLGGGLLTFLGKLLIDFMNGHVTVH
jgi:ribosomal protein L24